MAFSTSEREQNGYATAAAVVACTALATVATAMLVMFETERLASHRYRQQAERELALELAHRTAVSRVLEGVQTAPLRWSSGRIMLLAEPERLKAAVSSEALTGEQRAWLRLSDEDGWRAKLLEASALGYEQWNAVAEADSSSRWKRCARSLLSRYSAMEVASNKPAEAPRSTDPNGRAGEVWRFRAVTPEGWTDDRLVRFTGREELPSTIIDRTFGRTTGTLCDMP